MFDAAEIVNQFHSRLFTHTWTSGEVVGRVAHECQQVDNLEWGSDAVFLAYLLGAHHLVAATMTRSVDVGQLSNQLPIVFIGGEHVALYTDGICLFSQGSDDIVGLEAIDLKDRNVIRTEYIFDDGNGLVDVLWRCVTLGFIGRKSLAAERRTMRVEGHADMRWLLLLQHFIQRVTETDNGRGVLTFGIDTRVLDEGVIGTINERVSV